MRAVERSLSGERVVAVEVGAAREVREYFIPDFSNWKDHNSYQAAFQRLVGDLKAEQAGPAEVR